MVNSCSASQWKPQILNDRVSTVNRTEIDLLPPPAGELQFRNFTPRRESGHSERSKESRWQATASMMPRRFFATTIRPTLQPFCGYTPRNASFGLLCDYRFDVK
jgi:hypothetical protein